MWQKFYLPEIHDIYPTMQPDVDDLIAMFPKAARDKISMSIVPNWQGRDRLDEAPEFAARIKALPGTKVLHGWTHSLGPNLLDWIFYKHDNRSEFRNLTRAEADDRLDQGSAMFGDCFGARPNWFCAPRWQQSRAASDSLAARDYEGHFSIKAIHLADQSEIPLKALNFDEGERGWKIALAWPLRRLLIRRLLRSLAPFRLVLHPHDALHAPTRQQFQELAAHLEADGWMPLALDDVIAKWRTTA